MCVFEKFVTYVQSDSYSEVPPVALAKKPDKRSYDKISNDTSRNVQISHKHKCFNSGPLDKPNKHKIAPILKEN